MIISIVGDAELVDMDFGTGAVKITPSHDPNDFISGQKNNLPLINIFNDNGKYFIITSKGSINQNGGEFEGMMRFDARIAIENKLKELDLFHNKKKHSMRIGKWAKTGDIIEPIMKPQWYLNCKEMAAKAVEAVKSGELKIIPKTYEKVWFDWLENIQDWWLSRQLWWGHRIPAYQISGSQDEWVVGRSLEEVKNSISSDSAANKKIIQDEDVLDTWFSSALFPFYTLGWPDEESIDYKNFFPGDLLETGNDIIFFWVARMVMMSLTLTGKLPFKEVYLNPIVRDQDGKKMSKSLGNVIDPLQVIDGWTLDQLQQTLRNSSLSAKEIKRGVRDKQRQFPNGIPPCGSDALRFSLLSYMIQPRGINVNPNVIISYRLFNNKLWNASKYIVSQLPPDKLLSLSINNNELSLVDKWILIKLNKWVEDCNSSLNNYEFGKYARSFQFTNDLFDVYIEVSKRQISDSLSPQCQKVLLKCLDHTLKLMAPALPYITEEIYQHLNIVSEEKFESLCIAEYPQSVDLSGINISETAKNMDFILDISQRIRSILGQLNSSKYTAGKKDKINIYISSNNQYELLNDNAYVIESLTGTNIWVNESKNEDLDTLNHKVEFDTEFDAYWQFDIKNVIDMAEESKNLELSLEKLQRYHDGLVKKMENQNFINRAPAEIVNETRAKLVQSQEKIRLIKLITEFI